MRQRGRVSKQDGRASARLLRGLGFERDLSFEPAVVLTRRRKPPAPMFVVTLSRAGSMPHERLDEARMFKSALLIAAGAAALTAAAPANAQYHYYWHHHHHHHHWRVSVWPSFGYAYPVYSYPVYYAPAYYAYPVYPAYPTFGISIGFGGYRHHYYRPWW